MSVDITDKNINKIPQLDVIIPILERINDIKDRTNFAISMGKENYNKLKNNGIYKYLEEDIPTGKLPACS